MTPEQALEQALATRPDAALKHVAMLGVPGWAGALLPLRVELGAGQPVWHVGLAGIEPLWALRACTVLWPDLVAQGLGGIEIHSPSATRSLTWRPGLDHDGLATLLVQAVRRQGVVGAVATQGEPDVPEVRVVAGKPRARKRNTAPLEEL